MWWNGLWIHSISSEWPSVVHKLYSYWCFHGSCNILAFCLPSFNSNDRSADNSFCITILMVIANGYLKKYHKKNIIKLKAFFCVSLRLNLSRFCWWPMTKDFISKSQMYNVHLKCHSWFCKQNSIFSVYILWPFIEKPCLQLTPRKTNLNNWKQLFPGSVHSLPRFWFCTPLTTTLFTFPSKLGFVYYWEIFG